MSEEAQRYEWMAKAGLLIGGIVLLIFGLFASIRFRYAAAALLIAGALLIWQSSRIDQFCTPEHFSGDFAPHINRQSLTNCFTLTR